MQHPSLMNRRMAGVLNARLPEAKLQDVADPRDRRGRRWALEILLRVVVVSIAAGSKSLAQAEKMTQKMSRAMARMLGVERRVADTTLRDLLCQIDPDELRKPLHAVIRAAHRRKALDPVGLPFGVATMDGKDTALPSCDDRYAQRQTPSEGSALVGVLRTMTCTLVSAAARPCIDAIPIPAHTNEMGQFAASFRSLMATYGKLDLFRLVTYDAGACSLQNADLVVREHHKHYLFALKDSQPTLRAEAERHLACLAPEQAAAFSEDIIGTGSVVRRVYLTEQMAGLHQWEHLRTVLRIESETLDKQGKRTAYENRYYAASLSETALSPKQWLHVVRAHWGVENNCHNTFDTIFEEDDHPWIESSPKGTLAVVLLRRLAYNLLTLFRSVTQRSDDKRAEPWRDLVAAVYDALISTTYEQLTALRPRYPDTAPA
jgi:predicted transposase YbfD/YdcC